MILRILSRCGTSPRASALGVKHPHHPGYVINVINQDT